MLLESPSLGKRESCTSSVRDPTSSRWLPCCASSACGCPACDTSSMHTGQHYDEQMSARFFDELGLPTPDGHLGVGSGTHAVQTARAFERIASALSTRSASRARCRRRELDACVCARRRETGRSRGARRGRAAQPRSDDAGGDQPHPDGSAVRLPVHDVRSALANLTAEGIPGERVFFVGNVDDRHAGLDAPRIEASTHRRALTWARERVRARRRCIARGSSTAAARTSARLSSRA